MYWPPLDDQIPPLQGLLGLEDQLSPSIGLDQVAVRPEAHGLDGGGRVSQRGQHDDLGLGPSLLDLGQQVQPGAAGHRDVQRGEVDFELLEPIDAAAAVSASIAAVAGRAQPAGDQPSHRRLVIDDQDGGSGAGRRSWESVGHSDCIKCRLMLTLRYGVEADIFVSVRLQKFRPAGARRACPRPSRCPRLARRNRLFWPAAGENGLSRTLQ